mmetsp:Transcript_1030/g.3943  ORF Transcript_1030/g.3943 Transcript_1030/m.3943 type:complete len:201 (+) Transcript_1030:3245-3847(+)
MSFACAFALTPIRAKSNMYVGFTTASCCASLGKMYATNRSRTLALQGSTLPIPSPRLWCSNLNPHFSGKSRAKPLTSLAGFDRDESSKVVYTRLILLSMRWGAGAESGSTGSLSCARYTTFASKTRDSDDTVSRHVSRIKPTMSPIVPLTGTSTAMSFGRFLPSESTTRTRIRTCVRTAGSPGRVMGSTSRYLGFPEFPE